jgi:glucose-1-phosphate thymidylyltransferase
MWGIIPAAGRGSRIQPLAFSKELLPVGTRTEGDEERPRAVSEYLVDRLLKAGADKLCFVISPGKSDILAYYGGRLPDADICYAIQDEPAGLCDALFRALPFIGDDEWVVVGLPDTIWFPEDALRMLDEAVDLSFLLFPVDHPELFDSVVLDDANRVLRIDVKQPVTESHWIWGAFKLRGRTLRELRRLWQQPGRHDEYIGTLINEYIRCGGKALGVPAGRAYVDVGTINGYREATKLLEAVKLLADVRLIGDEKASVRNAGRLLGAEQPTDSGIPSH